MVLFLSADWLARQLDIFADLPERTGVALELLVKVTDGPQGDVTVHQQVVDGRLIAAGLGPAERKATTEVKVKWPDAVAICRGQADPHVLYMQGQTKLNGNMHDLLLHLRPVTTSDAFAERWRALVAETDFHGPAETA